MKALTWLLDWFLPGVPLEDDPGTCPQCGTPDRRCLIHVSDSHRAGAR